MKDNFKSWPTIIATAVLFSLVFNSCSNRKIDTASKTISTVEEAPQSTEKVYANAVIPMLEECQILLGNGVTVKDLKKYEHPEFFYTANDGEDWVVYKTPNAGTTSPNSSNTRTELHQKEYWTPMQGGKLNGTCKVMHVSTNGDARVAATYSVVVGQIHASGGHENEPFKLFYKKFPGHEKGSVFWNYEINTAGESNAKRWDYSYPVWGYDFTVVGETPDTYPPEPADGVALGEAFSYEVNVFEGNMYLTFEREGHETVTFTKNLMETEYATKEDIPAQIQKTWFPIGRDGTEELEGYAGELQYFKQGAYNQTNGKSPEKNILWCSGADTYGGDIPKQYENGSYTEVWFKSAKIGPGTAPKK